MNLYLEMNVSIIEKYGVVKFDVSVSDLNENETFEFIINDNTYKIFKLNGHFKEVFQLNNTNYNFKWIYKRKNCSKIDNSIELKWIYIENSDNGLSTYCVECGSVTFSYLRI